MPQSRTRSIQLRGVNVNNLKNIDVDFPHRRITTICGVSGSGKTSLALDTLHAEGQRRFISSFSAQARQFLDQIEKPDVRSIDHILPSVAVTAERGSPGRTTTVSSATEILELLRLVFAELSVPVCKVCQISAQKAWPESVWQTIRERRDLARFQIGFEMEEVSPDSLARNLIEFRNLGFARALLGNRMFDLRDIEMARGDDLGISAEATQPILLIVDRLSGSESDPKRVVDSLETAFRFGRGTCSVLVELDSPDRSGKRTSGPDILQVDGKRWDHNRFSHHLSCGQCGQTFPDPEPALFNQHSSLGACLDCKGTGVDEAPAAKASPRRTVVLCRTCNGVGLKPNLLQFKLQGMNFAEVLQQTVVDSIQFFDRLSANSNDTENAEFPLKHIKSRLEYLHGVGVGYLRLNRHVSTLSQGEYQRIRLGSAIGSSLINMVYVLDEPTRGLHPANIIGLSNSLQQLSDRGNAVVLVDHNPALIRQANQVIELGPSAGQEGGEVLFSGSPQDLAGDEHSVTGQFYSGRRGFVNDKRRPCGKRFIELVAASGHNLKNLDVRIPLGSFCVVTGVSGSGKTSLVCETLYPAIAKKLGHQEFEPLPLGNLVGVNAIDDVILIDQKPIARSSRSNPVTYVKAFDEIRKLFASTLDAKTRNLKAGHFSFNVEGGRCSHCRGDGYLTVDMQFMADVTIICEACQGKRFRDEVLEVNYRGKNICQILDLSIREAFTFFRGQPRVQAKLNPLMEVGLGYLKLGQPTNSLSTGESQRLKMAFFLGNARHKRTLFLMDEPSSGLHMQDVIKLLDSFDGLISVGHSIVAIEHNLNMIVNADWVIDLGPGADHQGGQMVAQGTPETIAADPDSITGNYIREFLENFHR